MTYVFNMHEAKSKLSRLVELAESGEDVTIARSGRPAVKLVVAQTSSRPLFGQFKPLQGWISDDFDSPLPEWVDSMNRQLDRDDKQRS